MVHIGKLILHQVHVQGISKSELARRLNVSPQNVYNLFKRRTIQASMLKRISVALKFDFFDVYEQLEYCKKSQHEPVDKNSDCYLEYQRLRRELDRIQNENDCLKMLIGLTSKKNKNKGNLKGSNTTLVNYRNDNTIVS